MGNNSTIDSSVPVLVETGSVLYGRRVVEIAAGGGHSAALCADGTLAVWGRNNYGQLGLGNKTDTKVPVELPMTGALAGKTIRGVSVSYYHTMVWCTDGTLASWGYNASGGLGNTALLTARCRWRWSGRGFCRASLLAESPPVGLAAGCCAQTALWPPGAAMSSDSWATTVPATAACRCWWT